MRSWRVIALGAVLAAIAAGASAWISPLVVLPPLGAAIVVLTGAAVLVDYFGIVRKRARWGGLDRSPVRAWRRVRVLRRRFDRERAAGSPRAAWTARSLLVALADLDRLVDAREVVDFLAVDAVYTRVGADVTADALRAVALAELGRGAEAGELLEALVVRSGHLPVVAYAAARVAERAGRPSEALRHADRAASAPAHLLPPAARRDVRIVRARSLAALSRPEDAAAELAELVADGHARAVELCAEAARERGDTRMAMAARAALGRSTPYR